jgi:magnesium-transporting ATPase (P-type)
MYLLNKHSKEFKKISKEKISVLHWKQFNSARKRTTLVLQKLDNEKKEVMVFSKGIKHKILEFCTHLYQEGEGEQITNETKEDIDK